MMNPQARSTLACVRTELAQFKAALAHAQRHAESVEKKLAQLERESEQAHCERCHRNERDLRLAKRSVDVLGLVTSELVVSSSDLEESSAEIMLYPCAHCTAVCVSRSTLALHKASHSSEKKKKERKREAIRPSLTKNSLLKVYDAHICSTCNVQFPSKKQLLNHIESKQHTRRLASSSPTDFIRPTLSSVRSSPSLQSSPPLVKESEKLQPSSSFTLGLKEKSAKYVEEKALRVAPQKSPSSTPSTLSTVSTPSPKLATAASPYAPLSPTIAPSTSLHSKVSVIDLPPSTLQTTPTSTPNPKPVSTSTLTLTSSSTMTSTPTHDLKAQPNRLKEETTIAPVSDSTRALEATKKHQQRMEVVRKEKGCRRDFTEIETSSSARAREPIAATPECQTRSRSTSNPSTLAASSKIKKSATSSHTRVVSAHQFGRGVSVHYCDVCGVNCQSPSAFSEHLKSKRHLLAVQKLEQFGRNEDVVKKDAPLFSRTSQNGLTPKVSSLHKCEGIKTEMNKLNDLRGDSVGSVYVCRVCLVTCPSGDAFRKHLCGKNHSGEVETSSLRMAPCKR